MGRTARVLHSVRLRLLILALVPLIILMPLLLTIGMARWTADYDALLISNVESDLRIAQQYLERMTGDAGRDVASEARSAGLLDMLSDAEALRRDYLPYAQARLGLDFLRYVPVAQADAQWPVIAQALQGRADAGIDIMDAAQLDALGPGLAARARIQPIGDGAPETRGMVLHAAAPVRIDGALAGVLVGGVLLNRNLAFIDRLNALVFLNPMVGGDRQGTVTVFLDDLRISTNVSLFEGQRAIGTRVSQAVRAQVLGQGETWLDRAFVVNDWYISGYVPLRDSFGQRVGMLYVGFLEAPFDAAKRAAFLWMLGAFAAVLMLSAPVFLLLARGVFAPLEAMTQVMDRVRRGDLAARIRPSAKRDEVAQVGAHLNELLEQVQDRDRRLRAWADELNARVDQRTAELRDTNDKLEQAFHQLVMREKLAAIGEITAGVAHEIGNPVAVIQGNVDVIREVLGPEAETVRTELDLVDAQVHRIDGIVGRLLKFARPGDYGTDAHSVAPGPVLRDCLVLVDHVITRTDITLTTDIAEVPPVRIDPGELQQVVVNLIVNAVQAMGEQGQLHLALAPEPRDGRAGVALRVRDSGPGVPEDKLSAVFAPFFTTKQVEGTGLGLSISQSLVQRAGGLISVRNVGGAEFTVWLPAADPDAMDSPEMAG
ncbi:cache domain-containing protein [Salipiger sp. 1_MG-2023]|uniref:sensor histidine kinase n=1 Tax=Salipiger sp. 1_MG-2023 TaxID=3062665 RepID=UPI0026E22517|nr:cache domain-containing protein [Salipiger sp. 1_MG-2023]MDO6585239.1 cache domain-containing protein [Salipiger sp. 1_MG-2023]